MDNLFFGTERKCLIATGSNTNPDEMIRIEATWNAVRLIIPSFIKIKLLPQINESEMKMTQLKTLLFNK